LDKAKMPDKKKAAIGGFFWVKGDALLCNDS
jgi:hypothetical protein